ncbi:MAG: N-acetylmuramoyl-L-alanine amidase [Clostridia bacterium]|nr:N-acetylmuramoyl-L-alanine amidase [Clostridia bacterium]
MKREIIKILCTALSCAVISPAVISASADTVMGDIDGDGLVTSGDALAILCHSSNIAPIDSEYLKYADIDGDTIITSNDALWALRLSVRPQTPPSKPQDTETDDVSTSDTSDSDSTPKARIEFPAEYSAHCADRFTLTAVCPDDPSVTFEYILSNDVSDDGLTDEDGEPYTVLRMTNTGKICAFHTGTATVTAVGSNGATAVCTVTVDDVITRWTISSGDDSLTVTSHMMTKNDAYNMTDDYEKYDGILIHSTALPGVFADEWYYAWNKPDIDPASHAFVDDEEAYLLLPLEQTAWHAGKGANPTYLDVEICEPDGFTYSEYNEIEDYNVEEQQEYFDGAWNNAVLYTAFICQKFGFSANQILSHYESFLLGFGSQHSDPDHWIVLHDKTMDDFRDDVAKTLERGIYVSDPIVIE